MLNDRVKIEKKVWGMARHVFSDPMCAVSILETQAGGYCSRHRHAQRVNRFIVQSGAIDVVEYENDGVTERIRIPMTAGDVHDVEAGLWHRFEVRTGGVVVEVYFPAHAGDVVRADDIERLDVGGNELTERVASRHSGVEWTEGVRV